MPLSTFILDFILVSPCLTVHKLYTSPVTGSNKEFLRNLFKNLINKPYLWLTPQFHYDLLQTLLSRVFNSLEWGLNSPPKPHAFVSLPLESRPNKKNSAQDRINAKHWEKRVKDYPALSEAARVFRDKNLNEDYTDVEDYLSNPQVDESQKREELDDQFSTLKAKYITDLTTLDLDPSSTQENRDNLKQKFDHERESMVRCARDNNVSLDRIDISDRIDPDSLNGSTVSAIELKQTEKAWDFIKEVCGGDIKVYDEYVDRRIQDDPSLDRNSFIDESIQDEIDIKNAQIKEEEEENNRQIKIEQEENNRQRDEYLALQQQSEPFDPFDPDA